MSVNQNQLEQRLPNGGDKLNLWDEGYYEQSNPLVRSPVFSITNRRSTYTHFVALDVIGEAKIEFKGDRLSMFDECVFLQLLHYSRGQSLLKCLDVNRSQLIKDIKLTTGGNNYTRLMKSLERLESATLRISTPHILRRLVRLINDPHYAKSIDAKFIEAVKARYENFADAIYEALNNKSDFSLTVSFIQNIGVNKASNRIVINLDPLMILLYDGINTTRTNINERNMLVPAEIKLLGYIMSHDNYVYNLNIETVHALLGSTINLKTNKGRFVSNLKSWLTTLEKINRLKPGWEIVDGKVSGLRRIPYNTTAITPTNA